MGFTFNNEFNASAQRSVICSSRFIRYKPFQDDPEETVNLYETTLNGAAVAANVLAGLTVVGIIAVGAVYVAGAAVTAEVAIACAPYVVGTLTVLCGGAAVLGQGINDIKRDEVSSTGAYLVKGAGSALIGAVAGMAFCMAPAVAVRDAARIVARKSAASAAEAAAVNSTRILKTAMVKRVGGNALSIAFLVNNAVADIRGENPIEDAVGEKAYDIVQNALIIYSAETFIIGLSVWRASAINMVEGDIGSAQGLVGKDFEDYLTNTLGGDGSFSIGGREFDGGVGNRWWEAKSGNYWNMLEENPSMLAKFKSDMGNRLRIATDNGATYELFSNTPIPESIKQWLIEKGIPFTELLD